MDWSKLCKNPTDIAKNYQAIPNQLPSCGDACEIHRAGDPKDVRTSDPDFCASKCNADKRCRCAYLMMTGRCVLTTAACADPLNGAVFNAERSSLALQPCPANNPARLPGAMDDYEIGIDWEGIWDDYCDGAGPYFVLPNQDTACGPACDVPGSPTLK